MKFIDFFSGIGGFHTGLEKAGMKCIGWCEFDKFAQASYRAMYDTDNLWFGDDVTKVKGKDLPKADLWTFGFPCQDVSIAGKQKGIKEGTRSGLFYEIMRLLDECKENKPKWLVCENVKNLLSIDGGGGFLTVISEMAERGYNVEWKVFNSKNYGVPQNRERVYIVGYHGNGSPGNLLPIPRENAATLKQIVGGSQGMRVYNPNGTSCTLSAQGGGMGAKTGLYKITESGVHNLGNVSAYKNDYTVHETGVMRTLMACSYKHVPQVVLSDNVQPIRIRKLTPKECWRLQGFTDEQYKKAAVINSNSQLYKQAGNAVTVNVVEEIGHHIMSVANEDRGINK